MVATSITLPQRLIEKKRIFGNGFRLAISILCILSILMSSVSYPIMSVDAEANNEPTATRSNHNTQVKVLCPSNIRVNTWNGNLFYPCSILTIPGRGLSIEIFISYNSGWRNFTSHYGYGWQLSCNMFYARDENGDIIIVREDGRSDRFTSYNGIFLSPADVYDSLREYEPGKYLLRNKYGIEFYFDSPIHKRVTKIQDPNGKALTFAYDSDMLLTTITNASGREVSLTYADDKLISITDPRNRQIQFQYDANNNLISITDPLGNTMSYGYDSDHFLTSITDPRGNATTITYSYGAVVSVTGEMTNRSFSYDTENRRTTVTDSAEDGDQITRFFYDADDRISTIEDPLGNSVSMTWNKNNNLIAFTDANGNTVTYTYDSMGNLLTVTDASNNTTTYTYESTYNKVTCITDANGHNTTFEYDAKGNLINVTGPPGKTTTYAYDIYGQITSTTDANGNTDTHNYNNYSYITSTVDALNHATSFTYDNVGNMLTTTDANGNTMTSDYDKLNRLTSITNALDQHINYSYDANGNLISVTDAKNNSISYNYDALNRLTQVTDALGSQINYTHDAMGNLKTITGAAGHTTTFSYDKANRMISETDPTGNTTNYNYDAAGNLINRTDANNDTTIYNYDALNQPTKIDYPATNNVSYSYDAVGNLISMSDSNVSINYTYDAANRLTNVTIEIGSLTKSVSYTYDDVGNRITMTDPDGGVTYYTYDAANRLINLTNPLGQTTTHTYDVANCLIRKDYHNGAYTLYTYDAADRLLSLTNKNSSGTTISRYTYEYDSAGNRIKMTDADGNETNYTYDDLYRLIGVAYPDGTIVNYTYDAVGNRIQLVEDSVTTNYTYDSANRLLTARSVNYTGDNNGNLISKTDDTGTTTYAHDHENRLILITFPDGSTNKFTYYPDGRRLSKTDKSGATTYYFYDGFNALVETDDGGTTVARYTSGLGIDNWIGMDRNGSSYYYLKDGLDSVTEVTDSSEIVVATYNYDAFGAIKSQTGSMINPYKFTGREYDEESGLYYYRARYYDPITGRFMTADPIGYSEGLNLYCYVGNNPIRFVDPLGMYYFWDFIPDYPGLPQTPPDIIPEIGPPPFIDPLPEPEPSSPPEPEVIYPEDLPWTIPPFWDPEFFDPENSKFSYDPGPYWERYDPDRYEPTRPEYFWETPEFTDLPADRSDPFGYWGKNGGDGDNTGDQGSGGDSSSGGGDGTGSGSSGGVESKPLNFTFSASLPEPQSDPLITLDDILPTGGPEGTTAVPFTREDILKLTNVDLMRVTNAVDAKGVDFVDNETSQVKAVVLAIKTINEAYEHDYSVCNRFHDYTLESAAPVALPGVLPGITEVPWFWHVSTTRGELVEEALIFTVFVDEDQKTFTVDSRWLADYYPKPIDPAYEYVFNFQIWASSSEVAYKLLRRTLENLSNYGTVSFANTEKPISPAVLIKSAEYSNNRIRMMVQSWLPETQTVRFFGSVRYTADITFHDLEFIVTLKPGINFIEMPQANMLDAVIFVEVNGFQDKVYVGTAYWFAFDDSNSNGTSRVRLIHRSSIHPARKGDLNLDGCAEMTGVVNIIGDKSGWIGIGRALKTTESATDVRQYNALTFFAKGDGKKYSVKLKTESVTDDDYHQFVFTVSPEWKQYVIPFSLFAQQGWGEPVPFYGTDVKSVLWLTVGAPHESVELWVDGTAFTSSVIISNTTRLPDTNDVVGSYTVTTEVRDDVSVEKVSLFFSIDNGNIFSQVPMNGVDDTFSALIPGQPLDTEVRYYIEATDADDNVATDPVDAPYTTYHFQVSDYLLLDDFSDINPTNALGGISWLYPKYKAVITAYYDGEILQLDYTVSSDYPYAEYATSLEQADLTPYKFVSFWVKGANGGEIAKVGLRDTSGNESAIVIGKYLSQGITTSWHEVKIPLVAFTHLADWSDMEKLVIAFEDHVGSGFGTIYLDNITFWRKPIVPIVIDNFNDMTGENGVGGGFWSNAGGGAAIAVEYDLENRYGDTGAGYRISYSGVMGYGWAEVGEVLEGLDTSDYDTLSLCIKGAKGGEMPNIYLSDGTIKEFVNIEDYVPVTTSWQKVDIPLQDFAMQGVDITTLSYFEVMFEWEEMNGTIYLDDIILLKKG